MYTKKSSQSKEERKINLPERLQADCLREVNLQKNQKEVKGQANL